tara:strand:- start:424 stop:987 length:564 start_codon:yes stop_codon:yes gene_type:complete
MIFKKLLIYDNDVLFDILNEIKEYLNFELIKINKDNIKELKNYNDFDYLIIYRNKKNNDKNQIILDNFPIKLEKLIQIINLNFLKNKFVSQSQIKIGLYKLDLNSRNISKDKINLELTERETNLIVYLKDSKSAVKINKLQKDVWSYSSKLETHTVETHIYRLRKKIKEKFNDENFIKSSNNGYSIN